MALYNKHFSKVLNEVEETFVYLPKSTNLGKETSNAVAISCNV